MYVINEEDSQFIAPWEIPVDYRVKKLFAGRKNNLKNIVYLYEKADTSTFRYRVYNICASLEYSEYFSGTYFFAEELKILSTYILQIDVLILCRYRWSMNVEKLINLAKNRNIPVVFEIDDMVYNTKYISNIMSTLSVIETEERYDYWFSYVGRLAKTLEICNCAITTNEFLAKHITDDSGKRCFVIPNTYNYFQAKVSNNYLNQKENQKSEGKFVIGYFSGTPSHICDFLCVAPEVLSFLDEHEDAVLRIVGFMDFPKSMEKYFKNGKIEVFPLTNFIGLQKYIAEVDVNIVPLVNNDFSSCKSELKFFEASIVGTITCATPSYTYKKCIENGKNSFLCEYGEWKETFEKIYQMRNSKKMKNILARALKDSIENYAYDNVCNQIEDVYNKILREKR